MFNSAGGGRLSFDGNGDITSIAVINNCVNGGSAAGEWNWGCVDADTSGNISADPGWSVPTWYNGAIFMLPGAPGAALLDAGVDPATSPAALSVTEDYLGNARPVGAFDIGHIEEQP